MSEHGYSYATQDWARNPIFASREGFCPYPECGDRLIREGDNIANGVFGWGHMECIAFKVHFQEKKSHEYGARCGEVRMSKSSTNWDDVTCIKCRKCAGNLPLKPPMPDIAKLKAEWNAWLRSMRRKPKKRRKRTQEETIPDELPTLFKVKEIGNSQSLYKCSKCGFKVARSTEAKDLWCPQCQRVPPRYYEQIYGGQ